DHRGRARADRGTPVKRHHAARGGFLAVTRRDQWQVGGHRHPVRSGGRPPYAEFRALGTGAPLPRARWRLSFGSAALGATIHSGDEPDGLFFAWLGQFQWVQRLPFLDAYTIARTDVQLSARPLLVQEQMAVGGRYTVRGYRENTLVRDNAFVASGELRVPVVQRTRWADYLELAAFYDYGRSWNLRPPHLSPVDISSVGVGLRWALTVPAGRFSVRPQFEVYWGHRLGNVTDVGSGTAGGTIQDQGVQFQFLVAIQ